jgi:hypothetical protein
MRFLASLIILIFLTGCLDLSTTKDINNSQITEILEDIRISFNLADLDQLMSHYHSDFFHNGDLIGDEVLRWESRLIEFTEIDISNIEIDVDGNYAIASFTLTFETSESSNNWSEPSVENGDISYLIFDSEEWQIFGNQIDPDYLP